MSTRGTYQFSDSSDRWIPKTTVYVHYDNYPKGAASYFYDMLTNPSKGDAATQFIRSNRHAEITKSHDAHGDTEYRYDLNGTGPTAELKAYARTGDWDSPDWSLFFYGTVAGFIDRYTEMIEDYSPFREVHLQYCSAWINEETARQKINREHGPLAHLRIWSKSDVNRNSSNWLSQVNDLLAIVTEFPSLMTDEIAAFLETTATAS